MLIPVLLVLLGLVSGFVIGVFDYVLSFRGMDYVFTYEQLDELSEFYYNHNLDMSEFDRSNLPDYYMTGYNCFSTDLNSDWFEEVCGGETLHHKLKRLVGNMILLKLYGTNLTVEDVKEEYKYVS